MTYDIIQLVLTGWCSPCCHRLSTSNKMQTPKLVPIPFPCLQVLSSSISFLGWYCSHPPVPCLKTRKSTEGDLGGENLQEKTLNLYIITILLGGLEHEWIICSIQLGMSSYQLTFTPSFFRRVGQPPTREFIVKHPIYSEFSH